MGFRYRKSINLGGGFRINLSKHGVGYSWGVPGYRVTKTATGRTRKTYSIPGTGLGYIEESSGTKNNKQKIQKEENSNIENTIELSSGDIHTYQEEEYQVFLKAIEKFESMNTIANVLIVTAIFAVTVQPLLWITTIIGIILKIYTLRTFTIPIEYEFDEESKKKYLEMKEKWMSLNNSKNLWQFVTTSSVKNKKVTAGAGALVDRKKIRIKEETPIFLKTPEKYVCLELNKETLYFLPDKLLIIKGVEAGAISYDNLTVNGGYDRFVEHEHVAKDAEIISHTWEKVNKNGTPDKRYKNNRQLPVCKYGEIILTSANDEMNIHLCCSNNKLIEQFNT